MAISRKLIFSGADLMTERAKRNRPTHNPKPLVCMKCRQAFVGELWHKFCAICVKKVAVEIATEQLKDLARGIWLRRRDAHTAE
jgi:hypothetical protein